MCLSSNDAGVNTNEKQYDAAYTPYLSEVEQYANTQSRRRRRRRRRAWDIFWNFYLFDCNPQLLPGQQRQFAREAECAVCVLTVFRQTKRQSVEDIVDEIFREFDANAREANAWIYSFYDYVFLHISSRYCRFATANGLLLFVVPFVSEPFQGFFFFCDVIDY